MALTRSEAAAKTVKPRRVELVSLPTGGDVRIRSLTRGERRDWHKSCQKKDGSSDNVKQRYFDDVLLSMSVLDGDTDKPMFSVAEAFTGCWDRFEMADTSAILQACVKLNGIGEEVESKEVTDAVKNSEETPESGTSGVSAASTE